MTKEELQKHYNRLSQIYDEFRTHQPALSGGNAKTRKAAQYRVDIALMNFEQYVKNQDWELYKMITGGGEDNYAMAVVWDEFKSESWFGRDMPRFLRDLEKIISEMN